MNQPVDSSAVMPERDASSAPNPILVLGAPRSGTTWVSKVLTVGYRAALINEPDSEHQDPFAFKAKLELGRYPVLASEDRAPADYVTLWRRAFDGFRQRTDIRTYGARRLIGRARRSGALAKAQCARIDPSMTLRIAATLARPPAVATEPKRLVIKSVHACFAAEWLAAQAPVTIVVVTRNPLNVISSWLDLGYGDCRLARSPDVLETFGDVLNLREPPPTASQLTLVTWEIGLMLSALRLGLMRHARWVEVSHEDLCLNLPGRFEQLFQQLAIPWSAAVERSLREFDRPGNDPWQTYRIARLQPDRWRKTLSDSQLAEVTEVLAGFSLLSNLR
jgi:Sulfotransferase family